jgi:hypothetical protein
MDRDSIPIQFAAEEASATSNPGPETDQMGSILFYDVFLGFATR